MTEPALSPLRRVAAWPDRLGPCAVALALLVAVALLVFGGPGPGAAVTAGQGCADGRAVATVTARAAHQETAASGSAFDGVDLTAADLGSPAELGLPRVSEAAAGSRPTVPASYVERGRAAPAEAAGGSPLRPPKAA